MHPNRKTASIYVAILKNRISETLPKNVIPAATNAGLPPSSLPELLKAATAQSVSAMESVKGMNSSVLVAVSDAMKTASAQSFRTVYLASIAFGGLTVISALFSVSVDDKLNDRVARTMRGTKICESDEEAIRAAGSSHSPLEGSYDSKVHLGIGSEREIPTDVVEKAA